MSSSNDSAELSDFEAAHRYAKRRAAELLAKGGDAKAVEQKVWGELLALDFPRHVAGLASFDIANQVAENTTGAERSDRRHRRRGPERS